MRLTWVMLFRAVVVAALLVSTVAIRLGTGEDVFGTGHLVVYVACATSYAAILAGALWMQRPRWRAQDAERREQSVRVVAHLQLLWDAVFATLLTLSAGGIGSAFAFLYFLTVLVAASLVGRRGVLLVAAECALLYGGVLVAELMGLLGRFGAPAAASVEDLALPFLTNVLGMFLIAILAGYLTDQLRKTSESLSATRAHLFQLEELHGAVLASLPSGVLTVDDKGVILYVNAAGAQILGKPASHLVGRPIGSVAEGLPTRSGTGGGLVERERFEITLERAADRGGEPRIVGGSVAKLTGVEALAGSVVVFQDLTELRRLQRDVARADRLATIGRFAAGLAHEIRNPLAAMIGCLELLQADLARPTNERGTEGAQLLGIVQREAERLSNLVSAFLTYARPLPPDAVRTDMAALVEETARTAQLGAQGVRVEVVTKGRPTAPVDPQQMRQVLWNLVGNAIEAASPDDGADSGADGAADERSDQDTREPAAAPPAREAIVRIVVDEEPEDAVIRVEDNGPGVPEDLHASIFEPFFTTRASGTGLGLATCQKIVDAHGGTIDVERGAELGGACFIIRLPRREGRRPPNSETALPLLADAQRGAARVE